MKRSGIARRTPLARGSARLQRSPLVDRKAGKRQRSRAKFAEAVRARAGDRCEACVVLHLAAVANPPRPDAVHRGVHAHHVQPKARGGSDDPANGLWTCAAGHGWLHSSGHEAEAIALGLLRNSWDVTVQSTAPRVHFGSA